VRRRASAARSSRSDTMGRHPRRHAAPAAREGRAEPVILSSLPRALPHRGRTERDVPRRTGAPFRGAPHADPTPARADAGAPSPHRIRPRRRALRVAAGGARRAPGVHRGASGALSAQQPTRRERRDTANAPTLPREVARSAAALFNAPATTRVFGRYDVPRTDTVEGDVAVLDGPVTVAGRITGRLTVINADVTLPPRGARGRRRLRGRRRGRGAARRRPARRLRRASASRSLRARGGRALIPERGRGGPTSGYLVALAAPTADRGAARPRAHLLDGRTYNRVEGLPIQVGPDARARLRRGRCASTRSASSARPSSFAWDSENLGHLARAECARARAGGARGRPAVRRGGAGRGLAAHARRDGARVVLPAPRLPRLLRTGTAAPRTRRCSRAGRERHALASATSAGRRARRATRSRCSATAPPGGRTRRWTRGGCTCSTRRCASTRATT
jgi:hypothetical protein